MSTAQLSRTFESCCVLKWLPSSCVKMIYVHTELFPVTLLYGSWYRPAARFNLYISLCNSNSTPMTYGIIDSNTDPDLFLLTHLVTSLCRPLTPIADSNPEEPRWPPWFPSTLCVLFCAVRALRGSASPRRRPGHLHQHFQNIQVSLWLQ